MKPPDNIDELEKVLEQYHAWIESGGNEELCPEFMNEELKQASMYKLILGMVVHTTIWLLRFVSYKIRFWYGVRLFTLARIRTDNISFEPCQCGLNEAYTFLGIARLQSGDIEGAIKTLKLSALVWPCPHNTSFGLRLRLARDLEPYPEAKEAVKEYNQLAFLFNKGITKTSSRRAKGARG